MLIIINKFKYTYYYTYQISKIIFLLSHFLATYIAILVTFYKIVKCLIFICFIFTYCKIVYFTYFVMFILIYFYLYNLVSF